MHVYLKHPCLLLMSAIVLRLEKLTGFEKEHLSSKNVTPERLCCAYFRAIADLKFHLGHIRVLTVIMTIKVKS